MPSDEDLSALLPEPPPPRNTRRDAAIEAAMLRFDGKEPAPAAAPPRPVRPASRWPLLGRPQFGALLTAVLVGVIAVPVWLSNGDQLTPKSQPTQPTAPPATPSPAAQPSATQIARADTPPANPSSPPHEGSSRAAKPVAMGQVAEMAAESLPPPPAEPMPAFAPAAPPPPPEPAPAPAQMAARSAEVQDEAEAVVVTGSRIATSGFARRAEAKRARSVAKAAENGAWDACTVRDSAQNLSACKKLVDPSASGRKGRAAAQVADGLSAAWRGDSDAAIAAFGRAIDQSPGLAFAWLNRGLVQEQKGDTDRALADLDKAVRLAPNVARNYYQRSLFHSRQGETRRAREDWERATRIDPRLEDGDE
jgi:hypothetical protein